MRALFTVALTLSLVACGGGEDNEAGSGPASARFCKKMDACNELEGASVSECTDVMDQCLGDLLSAERKDWNSNMQQCLNMASCGNFRDCWNTVPGC